MRQKLMSEQRVLLLVLVSCFGVRCGRRKKHHQPAKKQRATHAPRSYARQGGGGSRCGGAQCVCSYRNQYSGCSMVHWLRSRWLCQYSMWRARTTEAKQQQLVAGSNGGEEETAVLQLQYVLLPVLRSVQYSIIRSISISLLLLNVKVRLRQLQ